MVVAEDSPPYRGIEVRGEARIVQYDFAPVVHRMAVRSLGEEQAPAFVESYAGVPVECLRIEPGTLRVWDARDEVE